MPLLTWSKPTVETLALFQALEGTAGGGMWRSIKYCGCHQWPCFPSTLAMLISSNLSALWGQVRKAPWFPFRALSLLLAVRRMRLGLVPNVWSWTSLGSVAKSGSCTTDAVFSELSSSSPLSHPPTSAASCLQTDLLFKWKNSLCMHLCQGLEEEEPVFLVEGSRG